MSQPLMRYISCYVMSPGLLKRYIIFKVGLLTEYTFERR